MTDQQPSGYFWPCPRCQTANPAGSPQCRACGAANPYGPPPAAQPGPYAAAPAPQPTVTSPPPAPVVARSIPPAGIVVLIAGVVVALGAFLPWATVSNTFVSLSQTGINGGDGLISIALGAVMALAGYGTRRGGGSWLTALIASLLTIAFGWWELQDINGRVADSTVALVQAGIGLWMVIGGGVVGAVAAVAARGK